jgi:hypothetical protein
MTDLDSIRERDAATTLYDEPAEADRRALLVLLDAEMADHGTCDREHRAYIDGLAEAATAACHAWLAQDDKGLDGAMTDLCATVGVQDD